jgi:endonuclease/exonuclease/phosphatase family metal-dependent hydrolase
VVGAGKYEATRIVSISFEGMAMDIAVPRGYVIAEGTVQDVAIRVIGTHLETADAPAVQREQVAELIAIVDELRTERPMPEVLVGDFNSPAPPAMPVGGSYEALLEAGFVDSDPGSPGGFTCCHPPTLLGDAVMLSTRIDLVVVRNVVGTRTLAPVTTIVVGDELDDRIPVSSPAGLQLLWPSDHAGVVAELELELDR